MSKRVLLEISAIVILGGMLFILTGCGTNDEYDKISNAIGDFDNLYIHSSNGTVNTNEIIPITTSQPQDNKSNNNDNLKNQLIGTWVCEHPVEDGYVYTYIFKADGTAKFLNLRKEFNYTDEHNFTEYSFDGNILELTGPNVNGGGGFTVINHIVTINGSSLTEKDTGNVYIKE